MESSDKNGQINKLLHYLQKINPLMLLNFNIIFTFNEHLIYLLGLNTFHK